MQSISDQRVLVQCLHVREELSTQFTLIDVTSQRQKKATPPTEERKYTIVQDARSHLVDQKFWRGIWRPTTGKGYLIVFSARNHLVLLDTWISIVLTVQLLNPLIANNILSISTTYCPWPVLGFSRSPFWSELYQKDFFIITYGGNLSPDRFPP